MLYLPCKQNQMIATLFRVRAANLIGLKNERAAFRPRLKAYGKVAFFFYMFFTNGAEDYYGKESFQAGCEYLAFNGEGCMENFAMKMSC